jgi:geranylgeranyl diphosphate synthase type I
MENQIKNQIEKNIEKTILQKCKEHHLRKIHPVLYNSVIEYTLRRGKRIRPLLFVLSYGGHTPPGKKISSSIYHVATAIEFLHNFMLIHDDIIDKSHLRRNKPTMHKLLEKTVRTAQKEELGQNLAIIVGDIIYAFAIEAFWDVKEDPRRKENALRHFLKTTTTTALGEFIDTLQGFDHLNKIAEKDVFLNYSLKTARYTFSSPLVIGAMLAGARAPEIQKITRLSEQIGQAFQIQDDVIGIFDSQKKIGKSILSDVEESKKTLLVCHAYHTMKKAEKKKFLAVFNKSTKDFQDLLKLRQQFIDHGSLAYCARQIEARFNKTLLMMRNVKIRAPYKDIMIAHFQDWFHPTQRISRKYNIALDWDIA